MSTGEPTKVDISEDLLNIRCVAQDRDEVCFRLKMTTPFQKMFDAYASQTKLNVASLRFLFDGTRINPTQSPGALKMEDGDTIDVYMEQVGGGSDSLVKDMKTFCKNKDFDMLTNEGKFGLSLAVTTLSAIGFEKRRIKANLEACAPTCSTGGIRLRRMSSSKLRKRASDPSMSYTTLSSAKCAKWTGSRFCCRFQVSASHL